MYASMIENLNNQISNAKLNDIFAEIESESFFVGVSLASSAEWLDLMFRGISPREKRRLRYGNPYFEG